MQSINKYIKTYDRAIEIQPLVCEGFFCVQCEYLMPSQAVVF